MKSIRIICVALSMLPLAASAQQQIISAFNAIIDADKSITESHSLQRDPETGIKSGQCDIYDFTLSQKEMPLVKDVLKAFREDTEKAYTISSGKGNSRGESLAVGDGSGSSVRVSRNGADYIYACFLAPKEEDPDGNHRYAYAMNYEQIGNKIIGQLIITYATTLQYRQGNLTPISPQNVQKDPSSWLRQLMTYAGTLDQSSVRGRSLIAGYVYDIARTADQYPNLSEGDKKMAREILQALIDDPKNSDQFTQKLLKASLDSIK